MLEFTRKISAVILSVIMLFSTLSFTIQKHICMGEVADVSFYIEAENCGMTVESCDDENLVNLNFHKKNCCDNTQEVIPAYDNEQQIVKSLKIDKSKFVVNIEMDLDSFDEPSDRIIHFNDSSPPFVVKHIYKLDESYLI